MLKRISLCLFLILLIPALLPAATGTTGLKVEMAYLPAGGASGTITFGITDTQTPAPTGHYIYWRLGSGTYNTTNRTDCLAQTSCVVAITTPTFGTYHFAGSSYGGGLESSKGTEVDWVNAPLAPTISITSAASGTVNFSITDLQTPAPSGHYIYWRYGTGTFNTTNRKDCLAAATCAVAITSPQFGTYHFVGTAYGGSIESPQSAEVDWANAPLPPTITITNVAMIPAFKGGTLLASTSVPATMTITYGESTAYMLTRTVTNTLQTDFTYSLTGLKPHRAYVYYVTAKDANGVIAKSDNQTFTTQ